MSALVYRLTCLAQLVYAVITSLAWMLVPRPVRVRFERPYRHKGIRIKRHDAAPAYCSDNPNTPFLWCIWFGSGAGYRGGAVLYLAFGGCQVYGRHPYAGWHFKEHFVFGLTNNANAVPLPGRWS